MQETKKTTCTTSSWVAACGGVTAEEQVPAKGDRTPCGRPHETRSLLWKFVKHQTQVHVIFLYFASLHPEQMFDKFPNTGSIRHADRPWAKFYYFFFFFRNSLVLAIRNRFVIRSMKTTDPLAARIIQRICLLNLPGCHQGTDGSGSYSSNGKNHVRTYGVRKVSDSTTYVPGS